MYRAKRFRVRDLDEIFGDVRRAAEWRGSGVQKIFVADGDALVMAMDHWEAILAACRASFPRLSRVSAYATARNVLEKSPEELRRLRALGLSLLYIGPESGDDVTLKRIAKGATFAEHAEAARRAHEAGMRLSTIPARRGRRRAHGGACAGLGEPGDGDGSRVRLAAHAERRARHAARAART
jgi:radical SAM superfamily enzyme YgiQ (UPF0313 family)